MLYISKFLHINLNITKAKEIYMCSDYIHIKFSSLKIFLNPAKTLRINRVTLEKDT